MIPALLVTMAVLICCSAFFSASEAALFYLRWPDRRALAAGSSAQRITERLLHDPDRLLSAVLFWNLIMNMLYFTLASMVGLSLERDPNTSQTTVVAFAVGSLLLIIFFSEMLPKSVAVFRARALAGLVGIPLAAAVRAVDPIMPLLRAVNELSRRVLWPSVEREESLEITDVSRAIELSTEEAQLIPLEDAVLRKIVALSELPVQEWMRPRNQLRVWALPVSASDLANRPLADGYLLISDPKTKDVMAALSARQLVNLSADQVDQHARQVACVPWCATVADAFQQMQDETTQVAVVVNEHGETMGVITENDVLDAILGNHPGRGERLLNRRAITQLETGVWQVEGVTNLSRLERHFQVAIPSSRNVTLGGVVQEALERLPETGDECRWGPFLIRVMDATGDEGLKLAVQLVPADGDPQESTA